MARLTVRFKIDLVHSDNSEEEIYMDVPCYNNIFELMRIVDGLVEAVNEDDDSVQATISFITLVDDNNNELF